MSWYYADNGAQKGPLNDQDWATLLSTGTIKPETLVWQDGMPSWVPYSQVGGGSSLASAPTGMATCAYCKKTLPADDVISLNGQMVCTDCKPVAIQMMKEGVTAPGQMVYAGFWIRFGAKFIDGIIGYVIGIILGVLAGLTQSDAAAVIGGVLGFAFQVGYVVYFNGKFGATLGKMACGLKIVRPDGSPLTFLRALGRYFAEILSSITLLIGYIMAAFDDERRALHDRIADTRVIKK